MTSAEAVGGFDLQETYVEDLNADPDRAAGGLPIYLFKVQLLLDAVEALKPGDVCVISDVDIQFLSDVVPYVKQGIADFDVCFQREFHELGVNIGFVALRHTDACLAFWRRVLQEVKAGRGQDQRIVNGLLYSGFAAELGMTWNRFPPEIWASSQALDGAPPAGLALHHANWIPFVAPTWKAAPGHEAASELRRSGERWGATSPSPKLVQLAEVRKLLAQASNGDGLRAFAAELVADGMLAKYYQRYFGELRRGPEWIILPKDHPARHGASTSKSPNPVVAGAAYWRPPGPKEAPQASEAPSVDKIAVNKNT